MLVAPVGRSFCWRLHANREFLENIKQVVGMLGNGSFLNSPWNTQVDDMRPPVSRQRRYCFTWNNYPLDAEEQLRSLAERKRIVVPRSSIRRCCSPTAAICHSTASIRHIILFSKVELALRTSTKFENDSSSYRKLEDCTLHIVHVLHTLHICDVQP